LSIDQTDGAIYIGRNNPNVMKKKLLAFFLLMATTASVWSQIPNNGFENWISKGAYEDPSGVWVTSNSFSTGSFYPVTKSTDHFPATGGNYSLKLENNTALGQSGLGIVMTNTALQQGKPIFAVTGNPNSFCGYYKFIPQNQDTFLIICALFKNGSVVSAVQFQSSTAAPNWTSFNIPFPTYSSGADSGFIHLSSYKAEGPTALPRGNSVLYVDNLSFNTLISGLREVGNKPEWKAYPNPSSVEFELETNSKRNEKVICTVFDLTGKLVESKVFSCNEQIVLGKEWPEGVYIVRYEESGYVGNLRLMKY
jgi:hypothetical protein